MIEQIALFLLMRRARTKRFLTMPEVHAMLIWTAIIGVAGAFATAAFREGVDHLQRLCGSKNDNIVELAGSLSPTLRVAVQTFGGLIAGFCLLLAARRPSKQAHADHIDAVTIGHGVVPMRQSV